MVKVAWNTKKFWLLVLTVFIPFSIFPDDYYYFPLKALGSEKSEITLSENKTNAPLTWKEQRLAIPWAHSNKGTDIYPVWADDNGTLTSSPSGHILSQQSLWVAIRSPKGTPPEGRIFVPARNDQKPTICLLSSQNLPPKSNRDPLSFWLAKQQYYHNLTEISLPGQALFAAEIRHCEAAIKKLSNPPKVSTKNNQLQQRPDIQNELEKTFAFFSGSQAISENLQLNRKLMLTETGNEQIDLSSLVGITTQEMDWKSLTEKMPPHKSDLLMAFVPADQPACIFPDFQTMTDLLDEIDAKGFPILSRFHTRTEDSHLAQFYRRQLSLPDTEMGRWFGRMTIHSVAVTASDPFILTGTDLGILFETDQMTMLLAGLRQQMNNSSSRYPSAKWISDQYLDMPYEGIISPDRSLSTYLVPLGKQVVFITNSLVLVKKAINCVHHKCQSLAQLDEYRYFRSKYPKNKDETAFVLISDQTIRKWCSPRWRISDSRRARALAQLKQIWADHLIGNEPPTPTIRKELEGTLGVLNLDKNGIQSSKYGNLRFMTPISEMEIKKVSPQEAKAYSWYRDQYQKNWRSYFDPIAIQLKRSEGLTTIALTVLPLIIASEYHPLMVAAGAEKIKDGQADPHIQAIGQFVLALDHQSRPVKEAGRFMSGFISSLTGEALNWLGDWLTVYVDNSPFWDELLQAQLKYKEQGNTFMENNLHRLPLALAVGVRDPLKLALFLSGLRRYIEQSAPGILIWEEQQTNTGDRYVSIRPVKGAGGANFDVIRINYASTSDTFLLTLSKNVIENFFTRRKENRDNAYSWPGKSSSFIIRPKLMQLLFSLAEHSSLTEMRAHSWAVLPILNEYRKRFGPQSDMTLYNSHWKVEPQCPGGKGFYWNEEKGSYESNTFGSPLTPLMPQELTPFKQWAHEMSLGLTFDHGGVEVLVRIRD